MLHVHVLGPVEARVDGSRVAIGSPTQRVLLAALAHARGRTVANDRLASLVWGEDPPDGARNSLKSHVSRLRGLLAADVIVARPPGYALTLGPSHVDLPRFEAGVQGAGSLDEIDAALALWRGPPFGEFTDHEHFAAEATRLAELRLQGRLRRADLLRGGGRPDEAAAELKAVVAEDPLREPAWIGLLGALHEAGRQAEATAAARRYREHVVAVGLDPSERFTVAEHHVFTVGPGAADPGAPVLPARLASIVGRGAELERIDELLRARRLVTLVGPGGVGKTTLALEAARAGVEDHPDGTWVAMLADVDDPASVVPAVARAVGAPTVEPLDRSLEDYLAGRRALLVLDSTEHVHAASRRVAQQAVAAARDLRVLTTSRRPLGVPGEVVVPVDPLDRDAAVELFRVRAQDGGTPVAGGQEAQVAAVCDQLDRLPLAIEMAAARLRGLGLEELTARLGEHLPLLHSAEPGRHQTLGEVVAWSYDLLDDRQQALLDQLSVFAGGFDLQAVEAVCGGPTVAGNLADLVDHSLVRRSESGDGRYHLLETVRSFAGDRLAASGAHAPTVRRFVDHHAALAERVGEGACGPDEARWADRLQVELPNLEAAHARAVGSGDVDTAVRIAVAPYVVVYQRLRADIGAWADATLPLARAVGHPATAAVVAVVALNRLNRGDVDAAADLLADLPDDPVARHAHEVLGDLHVYRGELDESLDDTRRAEELARAAGDTFTSMYSRVSHAITLGYAGRVDDGLAMMARVRGEATEAGIDLVRAWCDFGEGELLADTEPRRALGLLDRAVAEADAAGWRMLAGVGRLTASSLRARTAEPGEAVPGFERLIRHWDRLGDQTHQWTTLRNLVELLARLGAFEPAARLLGAVGVAPTPTFGPERRRLEAAATRLRDQLGDRVDDLLAAGRRDELDDAVTVALTSLEDLSG